MHSEGYRTRSTSTLVSTVYHRGSVIYIYLKRYVSSSTPTLPLLNFYLIADRLAEWTLESNFYFFRPLILMLILHDQLQHLYTSVCTYISRQMKYFDNNTKPMPINNSQLLISYKSGFYCGGVTNYKRDKMTIRGLKRQNWEDKEKWNILPTVRWRISSYNRDNKWPWNW